MNAVLSRVRFVRCRGALRLLGLGAIVAAASGCGSAGYDTLSSVAQVRFVDVSPGSPEVDFYVNGTAAAYGVGYGTFTSYLPVSPGPASVSVNRAATGTALVAAEAMLAGGRQYTAVVSHGLASLRERIFADQTVAAPSGQVALRVLNAVEGPSAIAVYISAGSASGAAASPATVVSVAAGAASAYVSVPVASSYSVAVTVPDGALNVPLNTVVVKAGSGAVRTVVFAGTVQPAAKSVASFVLNDADMQGT